MLEDRLYSARRLYESSPAWARQAAGSALRTLPSRIRYGPFYGEMRALFRRHRHADPEDLRALERRLLGQAIEFAYEHVPFYRRAMRSRGVEPRHIRDRHDLRLLPLVDKEDLRRHYSELQSESIRTSDRIYMTTGGSTGEPVGFDLQKGVCRPKEAAMLEHAWSTAGYHPGDRCGIIRGTVLPPGQAWQEDPAKRSLLLSSYHLTPDHLPAMLERLRAFRPRFIQAYPSAAEIVARFMLESKTAPPEGLHAIFAGSETMRPDQRRLIAEAFQCRVFTWYGHAERVVHAAECELNRGFHVYQEYGLMELVDESGAPLPWETGARGEIVGTALWNRAMPLLRYRTYDMASVGATSCPCRRPYPLLASVEGRLQEYLLASGNRPISTTALNMHCGVYDHVEQVQFHQRHAGQVALHYVPRAGFSPDDERAIHVELSKKLGGDTQLELVPVREIRPGPNGKRRLVIQEMAIDALRQVGQSGREAPSAPPATAVSA